jgi:hypothetical protein
MSSAILYAAIIAIWLGVLIPRWLKRDTSQTKAAKESVGEFVGEELVSERPLDSTGSGGTDVSMADTEEDLVSEAVPAEASALNASEVSDSDDETRDEGYEDQGSAEEYSAGSRGRVVAARRRMLIMLGSLTVVALGMVTIGLAAWWVALPPIAMLGGYLMLLREASRMDAEQSLLRADAAYREEKRAERVAARERAEAAAAAAAARASAEAGRVAAERRVLEDERSARIIDISGRVKDELYDQYADEKRAVGD